MENLEKPTETNGNHEKPAETMGNCEKPTQTKGKPMRNRWEPWKTYEKPTETDVEP